MKRVTLSIVLTLVLLFTGTAVTASAAYVENTTTLVTVSQTVTGSGVEDSCYYQLVPVDSGNPMPEGTSQEQEAYTIHLTGTSKTDIVITFTKPGVYEYTLAKVDKNGTVDTSETVYRFGMMVKNGPNNTLIVTPYTCYNNELEIRDDGVVITYHYEGTVPVSKPEQSGQVDTNDPSNWALWIGTMTLSLLGLFLIVLLKRKNRDEKEERHYETY